MRARLLPSTSTLTVPSGKRSSWRMVPSVPISKMSSGAGSLVFAFFCAARRMSLSWDIASSSAAIDFSRPTKSGTTMCGKTMMSRSGSRGTVRTPDLLLGSFLSSLRKNIGFLPPGTRLLRCRSEAYRFTWVKSFKESRYSSQRVRVPAEFPQTRRRTITSGPGRIAPEKESSGTKNASNRRQCRSHPARSAPARASTLHRGPQRDGGRHHQERDQRGEGRQKNGPQQRFPSAQRENRADRARYRERCGRVLDPQRGTGERPCGHQRVSCARPQTARHEKTQRRAGN